MCYFHTSSTISFKLKCDISRFTHCIHEEMRSGCVYLQILCENKDNLLLELEMAVCWDRWGLEAGGARCSLVPHELAITDHSPAQPSSHTPFLFNS